MRNPGWGEDWEAVSGDWILDPAITFLNHGSFGSCPRTVLDVQTEWREEMERRPVEFLYRRLPGLIEDALIEAGRFLDADPGDLVFVPNATTAVNSVLHGVQFDRDDEILITSHAYSAITNAVSRWSSRSEAKVAVCQIPLPLPDPDTTTNLIEKALSDRTKLLIVDHIASSTAAVFPIADIVERCRRRGVMVMVDAAHAPGMFPVSIRELEPDFWTGNFHKWVCAPKGAAILYVRRELQGSIHPLTASHPWLDGFQGEFGWTGTHDPTPYLTAPAAIRHMSDIGWERIRTYNNNLVCKSLPMVAEALGTGVDEVGPFVSMGTVMVPDKIARSDEESSLLQTRLYDEHQIEVPIFRWGDRTILRISAQIYNHPRDYELLAAALSEISAS